MTSTRSLLVSLCIALLFLASISPTSCHGDEDGSQQNIANITGTDFGCYGKYCGLSDVCDRSNLDDPNRPAPIDRLDGACFLHDMCYACAHSDPCCPDPSKMGIDERECDRVLLHRLNHDDVCAEYGDDQQDQLTDCLGTKAAAQTLFQAITEIDQPNDSTGQPGATNNPNATCPTFSCPYTAPNQCFWPCGEDGCGGTCGGSNQSQACPTDYECHAYVHACFTTQPDEGGANQTGDGEGDGDGNGDGIIDDDNGAMAGKNLGAAVHAFTIMATISMIIAFVL